MHAHEAGTTAGNFEKQTMEIWCRTTCQPLHCIPLKQIVFRPGYVYQDGTAAAFEIGCLLDAVIAWQAP